MSDVPFNPSEIPQFPLQDEHGVDLWQIETHLRMTPAERLRYLDEWANFVVDAWKANGIGSDNF